MSTASEAAAEGPGVSKARTCRMFRAEAGATGRNLRSAIARLIRRGWGHQSVTVREFLLPPNKSGHRRIVQKTAVESPDRQSKLQVLRHGATKLVNFTTDFRTQMTGTRLDQTGQSAIRTANVRMPRVFASALLGHPARRINHLLWLAEL